MEGLGRKEGKTLCLCDQGSWARRRAGRGERERGPAHTHRFLLAEGPDSSCLASLLSGPHSQDSGPKPRPVLVST